MNPEVNLDATIRLDGEEEGPDTLPFAELAFLRNRRRRCRAAFAKCA